MDPTVLITGVEGQDGSYLAELCIRNGWRVVGTVRDVAGAKRQLESDPIRRIEVVEWNMEECDVVDDLLRQVRPSAVFNLAGLSSGSGMFDDPVRIGTVNGLAVASLLEAIRATDPRIRFCQASSREVFGEPTESPQTEDTRVNPRSPYGAAKAYADAIVKIYRHRYGLFACSAILFNHESPRRRPDFVSRKITRTAASIKLGLARELRLGNLDTRRDWGFAGDYVRAMWLMLQQPQPEDFLVATGETRSVRDFCQAAFSCLGLDYTNYVLEDASLFRPSESVTLVGNPARARARLGWRPEVAFADLVAMMVAADLKQLQETPDQSRTSE